VTSIATEIEEKEKGGLYLDRAIRKSAGYGAINTAFYRNLLFTAENSPKLMIKRNAQVTAEESARLLSRLRFYNNRFIANIIFANIEIFNETSSRPE
jgi:hypothetical protein